MTLREAIVARAEENRALAAALEALAKRIELEDDAVTERESND